MEPGRRADPEFKPCDSGNTAARFVSFIWAAPRHRFAERRMETLYLLVEAEVGRLEEVGRRIRQIPRIVEVEAVTGPFDLIVKIQTDHVNEALDIVVHKIRRIPGIKGTETLVTVSGV
jgi:DNA-binding Lrp family transcriptional regulator